MGIAPDDFETEMITIGSETMRAFFTIFDFGIQKRIGFWTSDNDKKSGFIQKF